MTAGSGVALSAGRLLSGAKGLRVAISRIAGLPFAICTVSRPKHSVSRCRCGMRSGSQGSHGAACVVFRCRSAPAIWPPYRKMSPVFTSEGGGAGCWYLSAGGYDLSVGGRSSTAILASSAARGERRLSASALLRLKHGGRMRSARSDARGRLPKGERRRATLHCCMGRCSSAAARSHRGLSGPLAYLSGRMASRGWDSASATWGCRRGLVSGPIKRKRSITGRVASRRGHHFSSPIWVGSGGNRCAVRKDGFYGRVYGRSRYGPARRASSWRFLANALRVTRLMALLRAGLGAGRLLATKGRNRVLETRSARSSRLFMALISSSTLLTRGRSRTLRYGTKGGQTSAIRPPFANATVPIVRLPLQVCRCGGLLLKAAAVQYRVFITGCLRRGSPVNVLCLRMRIWPFARVYRS